MRQDEGEPELDPAAERVRQKLARLLLGSLGVMALGLLAVFGAILYKVGFEPGNAGPTVGAGVGSFPAETVTGRIALPAGAEIVSVSLDADRGLLQVRQAGGSAALWLVDLRSGRVLARYEIGE